MTTPRTRLQDAISGERRDWHKVEVSPDDVAALLDERDEAARMERERIAAVLQAVAQFHPYGPTGGRWVNTDDALRAIAAITDTGETP